MSRTLVILTYNEIYGVRELFHRIPFNQVNEVLIIDGGSTDGTREYFETRNMPIITQMIPGRGWAMRLGVNMAQGDNIVFFSPDGNENPNDIVRLFENLEIGSDMVIASRFLPGAKNEEDDDKFPFRKYANMAFTYLAKKLFTAKYTGEYVTDSINGFRGITKKAFNKLAIDVTDFTIEYQMTIRALKSDMLIIEIPTIEYDRIGGKSKAKSGTTGIKMLRCLIREIL